MDSSEKYSKKQLKELRKLAELDKEKYKQKQNTFRWVSIAVSSAIFLVLFVGMIIYAKQQDSSPEPSEAVKLSNSGWIRGKASSRITLTEFSDFQCPACKFYSEPVKQILSDYKDDVKVQFKHFPLSSVHKNAMAAAIMAEAAGEQDKFWEMHDLLFEKQDEWSALPDPTEKFLEYAKSLNLDVPLLKTTILKPATRKKVADMQNEGIKLGVNATPTFFLNGKKIKTPGTIADFKKVIDEELSK